MAIFLTTVKKFVSWSGGIFNYLPSLLNKPQTLYIIQNCGYLLGKQLVSFITCGCESSASFLEITNPVCAVLVIGLYELLGNPTT
jgi:hypothetical protein